MSLIYTLNVAKLFLLSIILKRDHPRAILQPKLAKQFQKIFN